MSTTCDKKQKVYTVEDWLFGCVNFSVPKSAVSSILASRGVDNIGYAEYRESEDLPDIRLLKADLLKWVVLGAGQVNNTSDSDNGWSHSGGGYSLSKEDKKLLMNEANAIYEELEPESVFGKSRITVHSMGIMPAKRDLDGRPLRRKP